MNKSERKKYSLDLFKRVQQTLLEATELDSIPHEMREKMQETAAGFERLAELVRNS